MRAEEVARAIVELEILEGDEPPLGEDDVEGVGNMPLAQDASVTVRPVWSLRVDPEKMMIQSGKDVDRGEGSAEVRPWIMRCPDDPFSGVERLIVQLLEKRLRERTHDHSRPPQ